MTSLNNQEKEVKRGRGRPRKIVNDDDNKSTTSTTSTKSTKSTKSTISTTSTIENEPIMNKVQQELNEIWERLYKNIDVVEPAIIEDVNIDVVEPAIIEDIESAIIEDIEPVITDIIDSVEAVEAVETVESVINTIDNNEIINTIDNNVTINTIEPIINTIEPIINTIEPFIIDNVNIGSSVFYELVNVDKLKYIINHFKQYEDIIKEQEKDMRRKDKNYNAYLAISKNLNNIYNIYEISGVQYGYIKVEYSKGRNSNGIGRWYCKNGVGLQPLISSVRGTICNDIWVDIDQVNSHPTIFNHLMKKYDFKSKMLNECLTDRETFLKKIMGEVKCSRDTAKTYVIAIINGAKYTSPILKQLANELIPAIEYINNLPEYNSIVDYVKKTYPNIDNINGKIISRILQIIENSLLECYIEFCKNKGLIKNNNEVALIFDGFQLLKNDAINDDLLNEIRKYAFNKTGYDIELKIKPFDNCLDIPSNYADKNDDVNGCIIDKYLKLVKNKNNDDNILSQLDISIGSEGAHSDVSKLLKLLLKDDLVFDEVVEKWFICNKNNVWIESPTGIIIKTIIIQVLPTLYTYRAIYYNNKSNEEGIDKERKNCYSSRGVEAFKIANKLKSISYIKSIFEMCKCDFLCNEFYEKKLDSKGYLFAFNDKLLDCRQLIIRDIQPTDYILTTTNYNYPNIINEECKNIINDYYNTIYPDEEVREYMWNNNSLTLNGEKKFQSFNIHSGGGSNSKSTAFNMLKEVLGGYFIELNAETFTKPPKTANSTSELYKCKGSRLVITNEPENDTENKLQGGLIKKMADGFKNTLKARGLYADAIEFPIFFRVEMSCNSKPTLSSVDGGVGRRIRNINYPVKFVSNPDPNNKHQALLNLEMGDILTSEKIRNTYILMLIDRFINISSKLTTEIIPKQIQQDSNDYISDCNEVLGFISEKYIITNNEKDRIQSSDLFIDFKHTCNNNKMTSSKFKEDILNIGGITAKKMKNGNYYCGLKLNDNSNEFIDE